MDSIKTVSTIVSGNSYSTSGNHEVLGGKICAVFQLSTSQILIPEPKIFLEEALMKTMQEEKQQSKKKIKN